MQQYDFNKNFSDFRKNINLTEQDRDNLIKARNIIRATIKQTFNEMPSQYFTREVKTILADFSQNIDKTVTPKFMTQGSFVYNTINQPENPPIQQMDLDDGVYLPLSYVENEVNGNFKQAAEIVRDIIYNCINDLHQARQWKIDRKPKCFRVTINSKSHIDLPIYSIPDNQSDTIKDSVEFSAMNSIDRSLYWNKAESIFLATDDGWIESDSRKILQWVKNTKDNYGNNFIYCSRYFKAWRDHQYPKDDSKFSSIMIMAGIAQALSEYGYSKNNNVALDLSTIATSLKLYLSNGGITHPTENGIMDENLPNKNEIIDKLNALAINLSKATKTDNTQLLIDCFGNRFPNDRGDGSNISSVTPAIASTIPIKQYRKF